MNFTLVDAPAADLLDDRAPRRAKKIVIYQQIPSSCKIGVVLISLSERNGGTSSAYAV